MIIYYDFASQGHAGSLSKNIIDCLGSKCRIIALLHKDYAHNHLSSLLRLYGYFDKMPFKKGFKFAELLITFLSLYIISSLRFFYNKKKDLVIINVHQPFSVFYYFAKYSRYIDVYFIIHDSIPHKNYLPKLIQCSHDDLISSATKIIVMGDESLEILSKKTKRVGMFLFPIMSSFASVDNSKQRRFQTDLIKFLFIGSIREEKGLQYLLDAWRRIYHQVNGTLTIAGRYDHDFGLDFNGLENANLNLGFIDDSLFEQLIYDHDYIVLPYSEITNSGIYYTAINLDKICITSDIPIFMNSDFSIEELRFKKDNVDELCKILIKAASLDQDQYAALVNKISDAKKNYMQKFEESLLDCFKNEIIEHQNY